MAREGFGRMKYLHIVPGADDVANGMARVARLLAKEQGDAVVVDLSAVSGQSLAVSEGSESLGFVESLEEVWVHGMWLPKEWAICRRVIKAGKRLVRMTHGSLSPVYLKNQSPIKKWLVGPIERYWLRKADRIVATCDAEKAWIEAYLGKRCPEIVVEDIKRFFKLGVRSQELGVRVSAPCGCSQPIGTRASRATARPSQELGVSEGFSRKERKDRKENEGNGSKQEIGNKKLNVLYLGRRHPLKGVEYLEKAVKELGVRSQGLVVSEDGPSSSKLETINTKHETRDIELKIVSNAFGEELEKVWEWCDVLVLSTLSENFGLVVAEALERGKCVITTDGAPAWGDGNDYGGRLMYLKGYRDGSDEERIKLLKDALMMMV